MAFDAFVNFGDIKGESTDKDHKDWVQITSYRQSVNRTPLVAATKSGPAFSEFTITKLLDAATPKLFEACCKGTHLKEVVIELVRAGGDPVKYMEVKLADVVITSVADDAESTGTAQHPSESIHMTFGAIEWTYTKQKPDGTAAGNVVAKWNVAQGASA